MTQKGGNGVISLTIGTASIFSMCSVKSMKVCMDQKHLCMQKMMVLPNVDGQIMCDKEISLYAKALPLFLNGYGMFYQYKIR